MRVVSDLVAVVADSLSLKRVVTLYADVLPVTDVLSGECRWRSTTPRSSTMP